MKKIIIIVIVLGVLLSLGFTAYLVLQKDDSRVAEVIDQNKTAKEETYTEEVVVDKLVKSGNFNYLDPLHYGKGSVEIFDAGEFYRIKMSSDFQSADAPDPYVYLGSIQDFKDRAISGVDTSKTLNIGKLKSFAGSQEYLVSKEDFQKHDAAVIIWCKKFGVQISRADLQ